MELKLTIAFVPVRGGSKSIPLKNIKPFCGRPLVYWSISVLQEAPSIDKIIVATDALLIKETVVSFGFDKVTVFDRSPENASDIASTESVMLEYIATGNLSDDDVFVLVQATSPLTESYHFEEALQFYKSGRYDSILSCVRNKRFFWNDDGTSKNYDYRLRPRRQEFRGVFMENGAFYINKVANIKCDENRLSGRIGIYEMQEYTATEIDEVDDWIILENLMQRHVLSKRKPDYLKIKLIISDVDGVLTDGGMYYSENGDELKKFNTRDGMAFQVFREKGIKIAIITSENTKMVWRRAEKLHIDFLIQGKRNSGKLEAAEEICTKMGITLSEVAFVGDDVNDIELLEQVGFAFCPADAAEKVKNVSGIRVLAVKGGEGIMREIERMLSV